MAKPRRTRQQWIDIIEHWAQSDLTAKQYCEQHNLVLQTFHARRSDIKRSVQKRSRKFVNVIRDKPVENVMSQGVMMSDRK